MISLLLGASVAFFVTVFLTPAIIKVLRARGIGQQIRDDGPFEHPHATKAGTPTMGGVAILVGLVSGYLFAHVRTEQLKFSSTGITLLFLILGMGIVGFLDDWLGIRRHRNLGFRKRGKVGGQVLVASGFALIALQWVNASTYLSFTRALDFNLGTWGWFAFAVLVIMSSSNAVNITDGLDGLAAGSATLVFAAFMIICFWGFRHPLQYSVFEGAPIAPNAAGFNDLAVVAAAMAGACAGFLWWNAAPARIFMGDTGSLAIGAAMAGLALLTNTVLLLPILGGLYVIETLSVIAQIISFRIFRFRILRMAPIHHHFEIKGWPETTVIVRFWIFAGVCVAVGLGIYYADFIRIPGVIDR